MVSLIVVKDFTPIFPADFADKHRLTFKYKTTVPKPDRRVKPADPKHEGEDLEQRAGQQASKNQVLSFPNLTVYQ